MEFTQSRVGYIAFLNEDETVITMQHWSKSALDGCLIDDRPRTYPLGSTGLWGEAVRQRRPIITNDYAAPDLLKKGYPAGHIELTRHMDVPVFDRGRMSPWSGWATGRVSTPNLTLESYRCSWTGSGVS